MLAASLEDIRNVKYPVLTTPKLDGIRAVVVNGRLLSRTFKPIPNRYVREVLEEVAVDGMDGELVVDGKQFNEVSSGIMRESGEPDFIYKIFDYVADDPSEGYKDRMERLKKLKVESGRIQKLLPVQINNLDELLGFEEKCLAEKYEGIMLRSVDGPYKMGRSTLNQGWLLKWKRFHDSEAVILDVFEQMTNENEAFEDELGHTKRSSCKAGKVCANTLGGFEVQDCKSGIKFKIGTGDGLDADLRKRIWDNQNRYIGRVVKYKSQKSGEKDKPRFAVFLGFRDVKDI